MMQCLPQRNRQIWQTQYNLIEFAYYYYSFHYNILNIDHHLPFVMVLSLSSEIRIRGKIQNRSPVIQRAEQRTFVTTIGPFPENEGPIGIRHAPDFRKRKRPTSLWRNDPGIVSLALEARKVERTISTEITIFLKAISSYQVPESLTCGHYAGGSILQAKTESKK